MSYHACIGNPLAINRIIIAHAEAIAAPSPKPIRRNIRRSTFMRALLSALALLLCLVDASAQTQQTEPHVVTVPYNTGNAATIPTGGTLPVAVGGVTNLALAANPARNGCIIQNQGTHTMTVYVNPSLTFGLNIAANNGTLNCQAFVTSLGDPLYITGTAGDIYVLWWQ